MKDDPAAGRRALLWCHAGAGVGVGHAVRCLALAEGLRDAGWQPTLAGDLGRVDLVTRLTAQSGIAVTAMSMTDIDGLIDLTRSCTAAVVVLDCYEAPAELTQRLAETGVPVVGIADFADQWSDVSVPVNQNCGAEHLAPVRHGQRVLAGLRYALLRRNVISRRPREPRACKDVARRILVVLGGTDPTGAGPLITQVLLETRRPVDVGVIAPRTSLARAVARLTVHADQTVTVLDAVDELPALYDSADLVITAAGSSLWELACLGVPAAAVCVADNQRRGYDAAVGAGLVAGLGDVEGIRNRPQRAVRALNALLGDATARNYLSEAGWRAVDGQGRVRVVHAIEEHLSVGVGDRPQTSNACIRYVKVASCVFTLR